MSAFVAWLLAGAWPYVATVLAALIGLVAGWRHGSKKYVQGISDERAKTHADAVQSAQERSQVDTDVSGLPDGDALERLRRDWSRD